MKNVKFWGRNCLECLGLSAGAAFILTLFLGVGNREIGNGGIREMALMEFSLYPYYLIIAGAFAILIVTISYFQLYFSILLSVNVTRKSIAGGIWISTLAVILFILAAAGTLWAILPGDLSKSGIRILPLMAGVLFIEGALVIALGVVITKWGKTGMIILTVIGMVIGGVCGAAAVLSGKITVKMQNLQGMVFDFYPVLIVVGVVLYLLSGIFLVMGTRKLEARL